MANVKITELVEDTGPTTDDLVAIVNDPGGTPVTKKSTLANLLAVALSTIRALTPAANKIPVYTSGTAASALEITEQTVVGRLTGGIIKALSQTELTALLNAATTSLQGAAPLATGAENITGTEAAKVVTPATLTSKLDADGTLAGNLDTRIPTQKAVKTYADTMVTKALFDANTVLAATSDDTPAPVAIAVQQVLGRLTAGNIKGLTATELTALLNAATTSLQGAAPLCTGAENITGTDAAKVVTPATLTSKLDTDVTLAGNLDTRIATQKAVKAYADTMVTKALFDAYTILMATTNDTPVALTVGEQAVVGRITGGAIAALTMAQLASLVNEAENVIEDLSYLPAITFTWDPGSLADGVGETSAAVAVPGATLGDTIAFAVAPYDLQGITCNAYVDAADSVKVRLQNETAGTIDLASGTWAIKCRRN